MCLFPLQVCISHVIHDHPQTSGIPLSLVILVHILSLVCFERSFTGSPHIRRKFQMIDYSLQPFKEFFIMHVPTNTCRPERGISLLGTEF